MAQEITRVTSKGQMTIPVEIRRALGIGKGDLILVTVEGNEVRLRKLEAFRPLDDTDPIWKLIGAGESGDSDVSERHNHYLAAAHPLSPAIKKGTTVATEMGPTPYLGCA